MFGFKGKPYVKQTWESSGEVINDTRSFSFDVGHIQNGFFVKAFFDVDNVNAIKPDSVQFGQGVVAYDPTNTNLYDNNSQKYFWIYNSSTELTLSTRKCAYVISRPDMVNYIGFTSRENNTGRSVASNVTTNNLDINLRQYPNLKSFHLRESFISSLSIDFNDGLESVVIGELMNSNLITIEGQIPPSCKNITLAIIGGVTSVQTLLDNATGCEYIIFGDFSPFPNIYANGTGNLSGDFDLSHMTVLKSFAMTGNGNLTSLTLPSGKSDWVRFYIRTMASSVSTIPQTIIDDVLSSPNLEDFIFTNNNWSATRDIVNADIADNLTHFWNFANNWTGDVNITTPKPILKDFRIGVGNNTHINVDITGLTDARYINLVYSDTNILELPVNTVCTNLLLYGNNISIVDNPNFLTQITAMTGLVNLYLSRNNTSEDTADGGNDIGSNPDFSNLINLKNLFISNSNINGSVTLPNSSLSTIQCFGNPNLTNFINLDLQPTIGSIGAGGCDSLTADLSHLTSYRQLTLSGWQNSTLDISARTITTTLNSVGGVSIGSFPNLTEVILPPNSTNFTFGGQGFGVNNNPLLTTITNLTSVNIASSMNINNNPLLDITFPFSTIMRPKNCNISNNGMSQANVDATINNIYTNKTSYTTENKGLDISGTNASPTGVYQAPSGFVLVNGDGTGGEDGTPTSTKEQIYVLVNNYNWSITYTT